VRCTTGRARLVVRVLWTPGAIAGMPNAHPDGSAVSGGGGGGGGGEDEAVGNGHLQVPVAEEDSWSDVSEGDGPSAGPADGGGGGGYTLIPADIDEAGGSDSEHDDDEDNDDGGAGNGEEDEEGDGGRSVVGPYSQGDDDDLTDAEFWARALDESRDDEASSARGVRGSVAAALTAATIIVTARLPPSRDRGSTVPTLDGVTIASTGGSSAAALAAALAADTVVGSDDTPASPDDARAAVAAASARSMFPPPERGPPVAPARLEADDIVLTNEAVDEIKTLMAGLPLPPGGLPPWLEAIEARRRVDIAAVATSSSSSSVFVSSSSSSAATLRVAPAEAPAASATNVALPLNDVDVSSSNPQGEAPASTPQ
jgi:hypothetical protein